MRRVIPVGLGGGVGVEGQFGNARGLVCQIGTQRLGGLFHPRGVEGAADVEAQHAAARLGHFGGKFVVNFHGAGDHRLAGAVVVDGEGLVRESAADVLHLRGREAQDRAHGPRVLFGAGLHFLRALDNEAEGLVKVHDAGKGHGRHLAQREARRAVRGNAGLARGGGAGVVHGKEAGLGVGGDAQGLGGAGKTHFQRAGAQGFGAVEGGAGGGGSLVEFPAHARVLRALTGEDERYFTHLAASASNVSACANISRMIWAAGCSSLTSAAI